MNILLIGAPGSGKGTQAKKLAKTKDLVHLSTGDLFRDHLKQQSPLGREAKSYIDKGQLVPDTVTNNMVQGFLQKIPLNKGVVFDGYPRNTEQAQALDDILKPTSRRLEHVIFFEISDNQVVSRLSGRLLAPKSGCVYHITNKPPKKAGFCDQSGEKLVKRPDDQEETIRARLKVFHKENQALLSYYKAQGFVKNLNAEQAPEGLFSQLNELLTTNQ